MNPSLASGSWRKFLLLFLVSLLALACRKEGPVATQVTSPGQGVRVTKPWLSGFDEWQKCQSRLPSDDAVVEQSTCGTATSEQDVVSVADGGCDRPMKTMTDAVQRLAYEPDCTDSAVEKLESLSRTRRDGEVFSNLAAAYFIRAQRKDQPSDLVRALDAADTAVELAPAMAQARFNRALAEEALGFSSDAIRSWDEVGQRSPSGWAREAKEHRDRLTKERTLSAAIQWRLNEQRLPEVVLAGDGKGVEALVAPYRNAAQRFVEETVLREWADAEAKGNAATAAKQFHLAEMIAIALARLTRERYLLDVIEGARPSNDPARRAALARAFASFAAARHETGKLRNEKATAQAYENAELALSATGNPLRLGAMVGRAAALTVSGRFADALTLLGAVEAEARRRNYPSVLGRVYSARGFVAMMQGRLLDSVAEYSDAQAAFERIGDAENLSNALTRKLGVYRLIGNHNLTWREAVATQAHAGAIFDPQSRHLLLGECAFAALELGYPRVALRYQNAAVTLLQDDLARDANNDTIVENLRRNLGVAFRARAAIHANLGNHKAAQADLNEARDRVGSESAGQDAAILNGFRARLAEVEAQTLGVTDRKGAIASLTRGIHYASLTHFSSLMASLLVQRADLHRLDKNRSAEVRDLRSALRALRKEEQAMLSGTRVGPAEQMWSAYFARYQDTYRRLIQRLIEDGKDAEAFDYAEKARAFEPLHLILKRNDVPAEFRSRIRHGEPFGLETVKQILPPGTFLLQYAVMSDVTYVWIVWKGDFHLATLPVGNAQIESWTTALQRLGRSGDVGGFNDALAAPYVALLQEPLARIAKLKAPSAIPKVVIVPDRSMHGLPFAALRNGDRYVVKDYAISVAASATLHAFSIAKDRQRAASASAPGSILLVADPAFNTHLDIARGLSRLAWARAEATRIEQLYDGALHVDFLKDDRATPSEFLRLARGSTIIHVAAHGIANPDIPSRSFLLMAPADHDSGALDAERLMMDLRLENARLVVLAACSSAGGTPVGPEGLAPLVRPLLVAGVPGVIGTLWNVKENSETAELLVRFHRHYRDGRDADDALRLAQLDMLGDPDLARSSAVAWAPFQAIGYASSPFPKQQGDE